MESELADQDAYGIIKLVWSQKEPLRETMRWMLIILSKPASNMRKQVSKKSLEKLQIQNAQEFDFPRLDITRHAITLCRYLRGCWSCCCSDYVILRVLA